MAPQFSIITVVYNALPSLPGTHASLLAQTHADHEWVVVDGGSTDGSVQWLQARAPDRFISEPDRGIYDAMNKAVAMARGDWLYFLNAGDALVDAQTLAAVAEAIAAHPTAQVVYGDVIYFGERGERRRRFHWLTRRRLLFGDLCHQAAFVRRELFAAHGGYDTSLRYNADFDWFLRVFRAGARLHYLPRVLARFHDAGAHVNAGQKHMLERQAVRARYLPGPVWQLGNWLLRAELKARRWLGQSI